MSFNEKLPEWGNTGTEPPANKKQGGFLPGEKPPADWFNWLFHRGYKVLEEIRSKVELIGNKGLPGGYASLDNSGKVPADQLPFNEELENTVAQHTKEINQIEARLDTDQRQDVVLNAGVQILNSQKEAIYSLSGIKGRALMNGLGVTGALDSTAGLGEFSADLAIETTDKVQGTGSLKVTIETGETLGSGFIGGCGFLSGKYYIAVVNTKNISATYCALTLPGQNTSSLQITDKTKWSTAFFRFNPAVNTTANLDFSVVGTGGQSALFDAARVYEISKVAYDEIPNLTPDQVAVKYPFVGNIKPVRNPYAIRYGENLAPGYPGATLHRSANTSAPALIDTYETKFTGEPTSQNVDKGVYFDIPVIPGKSYTAAVDTLADNAFIRFEYFKDANSIGGDLWVKTPNFFPSNGPCTATIPTGCSILRVYVTNQTEVYWNNGTLVNNSLVGGTYHFKNWRVFLGTKDLGFKPREDAMLALQTDLFADPVTGDDADEIFVKDGQYLKLERWQRTLMNNLNWEFQTSTSGFKVVRAKGKQISFIDLTAPGKFMVKWSGGFIPFVSEDFSSANESFWNSNYEGGTLLIKVRQNDSGWGDNYTPTPDEIRAYFLGWKMYDGTAADNPYSGSGTKYWRYMNIPVTDATTTTGTATTTVPTTLVPGFSPYELISKRPTPITVAVKSEGLLTLIKGDNQIEVGSNIILRESVAPKGTRNGSGDRLEINYRNYDLDTRLNHPLTKFIGIYKDGVDDTGNWSILQDYAATTNGRKYYAEALIGSFDKTASYTVSYFTSESSLSAPFTGSYTTNEKSFLQQLLTNVEYLMSGPTGGKDNGAEYKANVVAALSSIGVEATVGDTWDQLYSKIKSIIVAKGNAEANMVQQGRTFSNSTGSNIVGTYIWPTRNNYRILNSESAMTSNSYSRTLFTFQNSNRYIDLFVDVVASNHGRGISVGTMNTFNGPNTMSASINLIDKNLVTFSILTDSGAVSSSGSWRIAAIDCLRVDRVNRNVSFKKVPSDVEWIQVSNIPANFDFNGALTVQAAHTKTAVSANWSSSTASIVLTS